MATLLALAAPAGAGQPTRTVFVTAAAFSGDLGGLAGADAKCQAEADGPASVVPRGTYRAWLSDGTDSPATRFTRSFRAIVLPDGTRVADDFLDLIRGYLEHPIDMDATGARVGADHAWTGTNADGTAASATVTCDGWRSERTYNGMAGSTARTDVLWSIEWGQCTCGSRLRLFCFQQ